MKFDFAPAADPNVFDCANPKPGLYRSAKGSTLIKPENNVTNRGNVGTQSEHVLIHDVDTDKDIIKRCDEVRSEYFFVCGLDKLTVTVDAAVGF